MKVLGLLVGGLTFMVAVIIMLGVAISLTKYPVIALMVVVMSGKVAWDVADRVERLFREDGGD